MKTAFQPSFVPSRTYTHPIVGRVDEYRFSYRKWVQLMRSAPRGVQSFFLRNNAEPHQANQYALKVFPTLQEAFASWQRQSLAARKKLAPPVRRICKFVIEGLDPRWGYQTCVASHVGRVVAESSWCAFDDSTLGRELARLNIVGTVDDQERGNLKRRLRRGSRIFGDLHRHNVGFYKHRLVAIDFGTESIDFA